MTALIAPFATDESGVAAIEYGLLVVLIAVAIVAVMTGLGDNLDNTLAAISGTVDDNAHARTTGR